mmetsp:Transcript_9256/g.32156  ORF Transcript_9256/g.32156 Transcript_9256/m.32156 type:complete len:249 (+) Transcript_9256:199-945(+)
MSSIGTGYDLSVTTYSPDGKVFQVEYAQKAVDNSGTSVGLRCKDGVVLGVEKFVTSKLFTPGTGRRVYAVDRHSGAAASGLTPDARVVVQRARSECQQYKNFYGGLIPANVLADRLASYLHLFTLYWYLRPMGAGVLLATYDKDGPSLYLLETSGEAHRYFGTAIGKGRQGAKTEIEKLKLDQMTCREGVMAVAKIVYQVHDEKDKEFELELGWVCEESGKQFKRVPDDLHAEAVAAAKAALDEDMED